jgi:hypothetical protein
MDSSTHTGSTLIPIVSYFRLIIIRSKRLRGRELVRGKRVFWALLPFVYLSLSTFINSSAVGQTAQPITINFDTLATGALVTNQYSQVKFSATGFSAGSGGPFGYDLYTQNNSGLGSSPYNAIRGRYNQFTPENYCYGGSEVFLDFPVPVKNFSFLMLNMYSNYFGAPYYTCFPYTSGQIDVYVNHVYYGTYDIVIPGQCRSPNTPFPINFLNGIQGITGIRIRDLYGNPGGPINTAPFPACNTIFYDDFSFTPDLAVGITNTRVSGSLNGTSQNALVGADIVLNASLIPSSRTGGTYSWTFTAPYTLVSGTTNSSSVTIRANDLGAGTASVNYTLNGVSANATVNINAVLPSLTSFTGQQSSDRVRAPGECNSPDLFWWYKLGCGSQDVGMNFSASVHAPTFISDPAQSGIKYVQAISTFRKENRVGLRCVTKRSSEANIGSGWQLDTQDPYVFSGDLIHRFSEGNDLTMVTVDYPGNTLTLISAYEFSDVLYIDDRFEMYVVYFTGSNATTPLFQRPLGKLVWNWGGLVVLDWNGSDAIHHLRYSNASPGPRTSTPASSMVTMQGNVKPVVEVPCPGGPPLTNNNIDSSRVFVKYHYLDFLGRNPAGDATHPSDLVGWNFWTSQISQCVFDLNCIHGQRVNTGLAFFYSGEFIQTDPDMANPPGSPGFNPAVYNRRFVYWCYQKYLHRDPTGDSGWDFWTNDLNSTGNYGHIIDAFQLSGDYRDRPFF